MNLALSETTKQRLEQAKEWLTPFNLHLLGVGVLALVTLYLSIHAIVLWSRGGNSGEEAVAAAHTQQVSAEMAARPLRGLDDKLKLATEQADKFYKTRLPYADSDVVAELGELAGKNHVHLARVQYVLAAPAHGLSEMRMDAQLSGDYSDLARFINSLERDTSFFLITNVGLNGQQTGVVSLRVRLVSYLREPIPASAALSSEATP